MAVKVYTHMKSLTAAFALSMLKVMLLLLRGRVVVTDETDENGR